jgi:hypothetical protein
MRGANLDLLIVADTPRPFFERFKDFAGLYDVWPRLDLLIYTPAELERLIDEDNPLVTQALREGVVLHARSSDPGLSRAWSTA